MVKYITWSFSNLLRNNKGGNMRIKLEKNSVRTNMLDRKLVKRYRIEGDQQVKFHRAALVSLEVSSADFGVFEEPPGSRLLRNCFDVRSAAAHYMPHRNSRLANTTEYYLWLLWRIQMFGETLAQICDEPSTFEIPRVLEEPNGFFLAGGRRYGDNRLYAESDVNWVKAPGERLQELSAIVVFDPMLGHR